MNLNLVNASNGSGEAVKASITALRTAGATTNTVDSTTNWPTNFIATSGKELPDGTLTNVLVYAGHKSGSTIIIDTIAPGYTDTLGNSVNDVIILKPTTMWGDNLSNLLAVSLDNDGTLKAGAVDNAAAIGTGVVTKAKIDYTSVDVYSATETDTGKKWVDGRAIYRKVLRGQIVLVSSLVNTIPHGVSGFTTSMEIVSLQGGFKLNNSSVAGGGMQTFFYRESSVFANVVTVDSTNIVVAATFAWGNSYYNIIMEYVK